MRASTFFTGCAIVEFACAAFSVYLLATRRGSGLSEFTIVFGTFAAVLASSWLGKHSAGRGGTIFDPRHAVR